MNPPNVLILVMDTVRAANVLPSSNHSSPSAIENFADEGTTFERAMTTAPWTLPSHASLFTGQYTAAHGTHAGTKSFDPEVATIAEQLRRNGYQTVAVSNNSWISPEFGFDRGFDDFYLGIEPIPGGASLAETALNESNASRARQVFEKLTVSNAIPTVLNAAYARFLYKRYDDGALVANWRIKRWLRKRWNRDRPFFMFVNFLEPHLEYDPPGSFGDDFLPGDVTPEEVESANQNPWKYISGEVDMDEREFDVLEGQYNGEIAYVLYRIERLLDFLSDEGILDETIVIITSDHGENIGEHELMDHQYCLYDTLLHVPLLIRYPGAVPAGQTVSEVVELRDLYPTIMALTGTEATTRPSVSNSVLPGLAPEFSPESRGYAIAEYLVPQPSIETLADWTGADPERLTRFDRALRSLRTSQWKFVEGTDGRVELYDIRSDPDETVDLSTDRPSLVEKFRKKLRDERGALERGRNTGPIRMNERTKRHLEDMGYL